MQRRDFLTSAALGAATLPLASASAATGASGTGARPQWLEWIRFEILNNSARGRLHTYLEKAVVPRLAAAGCGPVGVFQPQYGAHGADVFLLVPHPDSASLVQAWERLEADPEFAAAEDAEMAEPNYRRMETSLMVAFAGMPKVEVPAAVAGKAGRIFELRTYEAHNRVKLTKKVQMFNEGGEIGIFRETGLHPVFFGKTLAGPRMPNLTYMVAFENMAQRDAHWKQFVDSPGWKAIKDLPEYKDTVSTITDTILTPARYSMI